ncbi:MAG: ABC transporter ATP-binding protein [Erysipelotrichales bacterium]|nr:ABC transporter ATP-binding protein [Erysipelotrichales bacterium]MBQ2478375.1 ABC transporter ATP-binding protein [Erysipelotrichales bacterium]
MIKTLAKQIKEYKFASLMTPFFMILEVVCETVIPLLMSSIIDNGVEKGDIQHIYSMAAFMILVALVSLFSGYMGGKLGTYASSGFAKNLRQAMYENIQTFSFSNIDKFSTSGLVTRLTTDVSNVQQAYQMMLRMFVRAPASLIVAMVLAFRINARLASVYLYAMLGLAVGMITIMLFASKYFRQVFKRYDDLNESVQENVSAIRVVKAYVREDYEEKKFKTASKNIYDLFLKAERIVSWQSPLMSGTVYGCVLAISWIGAHMIVQNELSIGSMMSLLTYCTYILMSLMMLGMIFLMVTMSLAAMGRIAEVINEKSDLTNPENPIYEVPDGSIVFDDVDFAYQKGIGQNVLSDISISIGSGETIGILGMTGSGKTSLVSLISRLYDAKEGRVLVGGHDVREYDLDTLRNSVSIVLQKNELFSGTIYENLRWGDENATDEECEKAARIAQADAFIRQFPDGYNTYIEQGGTNVSGGQKQRICIARALLKKPKILILDDSTSAVDTATDAKIRKGFREDLPEMTKIIIAQRIHSVMDADKILLLNDGRVTGFAPHEELMKTNEAYRSIYEAQTSGSGDFDEGGDL